MRYFNNNISRFFTFIIALQILNMSIVAPNAQINERKSVLDNFNYIDTYVEYITEIVLKIDNAIPESKDRQQKDLQQHKQFQISFEKIHPLYNFLWNDNPLVPTNHSADKYAYQFIREINPPPPKA